MKLLYFTAYDAILLRIALIVDVFRKIFILSAGQDGLLLNLILFPTNEIKGKMQLI